MATSFEDISAAQKAMTDSIKKMETLKSSFAMAKQIVELAGERRKTTLSRLVVKYLDTGIKSSAEAEHRARACPEYKSEMQEIMQQTAKAEEIICEYHILGKHYESARSILIVEKTLIGNL